MAAFKKPVLSFEILRSTERVYAFVYSKSGSSFGPAATVVSLLE